MSTLTETRMNTATDLKEAELHNAQIAERYKRLQNAESMQFAETTVEPVMNSVATIEKIAEEPQVTYFTSEKIDSPVFTTEKFQHTEILTTPTQKQAPLTMQNTAVATQEQYSLSHLAKVVMAAFAAVVVLMLTIICVNTQIINRQSVRIRNLQDRRAELVEENNEIQQRIDVAKSQETIRAWKLAQEE